MSQKFLFIRHGRVSSPDLKITVHGWLDLANIRDMLVELDFNPAHSVASTENRCIETAFFLSRGVTVRKRPTLHAYGDTKVIHVVYSSEKHERHTAHAWGLKALIEVLGAITPEGDVVVSGHDYMPVILASQLIRMNGGELDWELEGLKHPTFPNQGEGILVDGTDFHVLRIT